MSTTIVLDAPPRPSLTFVAPGEGNEYTVLNHSTICLLSQEQTDGAFSLFLCTVPPDTGLPLHSHDCEDGTFYILSGQFKFQDGDQSLMARAGTCIHAPQGSRHTFKNVGPTPGTFLWIVTPGGFERFFEDMDCLPPGPPDVGQILKIAAKHRIVFSRPPMDRRAKTPLLGEPQDVAAPHYDGLDRRVRPAQ